MSFDENVVDVFRSFYERRVKELDIYLEGFGGLFMGRAKDGFVIGYIDKNKQFGLHDHVTVFCGKNGLEGLHRKVSDVETDVYMTPEATYISSSEGFKKLLRDMQGRKDIKISTKMLFTLVYKLAGMAYSGGEKMGEKVRLLDRSEALKKGLKPPCVYVKPSFLQRIFLRICRENILLQRYLIDLVLREHTTRVFVEQIVPGISITKRARRKRKPHKSSTLPVSARQTSQRCKRSGFSWV